MIIKFEIGLLVLVLAEVIMQMTGWRDNNNKQENNMDGQMDKIKGRIKQAVGDLTDNKRLKTEGKVDEFRGAVKNKIDKVSDKLKEQE